MLNVLSLYSGAGGLDYGFIKAGFDVVWANDLDKNACETYSYNIGNHIRSGDINSHKNELKKLINNIDFIVGGPPCQGFSVAGKMDPNDPRSKHVWLFTNILELIRPKVFLMENVKALGTLSRWEPLRKSLLVRMREIGYATDYIVLNAKDFNVPQSRERVFFIGFLGKSNKKPDLNTMLEPYKVIGPSVREALSVLDKAGHGNNQQLCKAKITLASNPVLRKSPYAGMLFNGLGRPIKIDGFCATLPATMGGNKTPIIDEAELYHNNNSWVVDYHKRLINGEEMPRFRSAPAHLRRLTVQEAKILQTFPIDYKIFGSQSAQFQQIGNAVPCELAFRLAKMLKCYMHTFPYKNDEEIGIHERLFEGVI